MLSKLYKELTLLILIPSLLVGLPRRCAGSETNYPAIHLEDGSKVSLLGITTGTHHPAPDLAALGGNPHTTNAINSRAESTVVWLAVEHSTNAFPRFKLLVYDQANTACAVSEPRSFAHVKEGMDLEGFMLDAYPRSESNLVLKVETQDGGRHRIANDTLVIPNAVRTPLRQWTPETLPCQKSDGDLAVTLRRLVAGAPLPDYCANPLDDQTEPFNQCVRIAFEVRQAGLAETNWRAAFAETSDAMGNRLKSRLYRVSHEDPEAGYFYQPALWQAGGAWKVRLEFSRTSGFRPEEIWSLTNLPVVTGNEQQMKQQWRGTNNVIFAQATVGGEHLKLLRPLLYTRAEEPDKKCLRVVFKADPELMRRGIHITLLNATDDAGHALENPYSPWAEAEGSSYGFELTPARDTKTVNVTVAVNPSRFVEFTVKPEKP